MQWWVGLAVGLGLFGAWAEPAAGQGAPPAGAAPAPAASAGRSETIVVDVAERHVRVPEWRGAATVETSAHDGGALAVRVGVAAEAREVDVTLRGVHGEVRVWTAAADWLERPRAGRSSSPGSPPAEAPMP